MTRSREAQFPAPEASGRPRTHEVGRRLLPQTTGGLALLGLALSWGAQAQAPPGVQVQATPVVQAQAPLELQKPAGADKGVLLNLVEEKGVKIAPPAGAIYAFGSIDRFLNPVLTHTFILHNDGKIPVVIDHLQSSCGCTSALLMAAGKETAGYTLRPGKQVGIKVVIDTSKLAPGMIKKFVWVMMPGETAPSFAIRLDATIEGVLTFSPPAIEFGRVNAGENPAQTLSVTLDKRLIDTVGGVRLVSSNSGILIGPTPPVDTPIAGGDGHTVLRRYTIMVTPKASLGVLSGTLSFVPLKSAALANKSNTKAAAEMAATFLSALTAPVTGEVFGKVSARPGTVVFGAVTQGDSTTRRITLVGKTEEALLNLKVTSPSVWVTAKMSIPDRPKQDPAAPPQKLPPMLLLEVTLNPKTPPGALQTQVILTTQDGERLVLPHFPQ